MRTLIKKESQAELQKTATQTSQVAKENYSASFLGQEKPSGLHARRYSLPNISSDKDISHITESMDSQDGYEVMDLLANSSSMEHLEGKPGFIYIGDSFVLGTERHRVGLQFEDNTFRVGIFSDFTTLENIEKTLLEEAGRKNSPLHGKEAAIKHLFLAAKTTQGTLNDHRKELEKIQNKIRKISPINFGKMTLETPKKSRRDSSGLQDEKKMIKDKITETKTKLDSKVKTAIENAWLEYGDFLEENLQPASLVFKEKEFKGDSTKYQYYTGKDAANAIPILWYKAPSDYPLITNKSVDHDIFTASRGSISLKNNSLGLDIKNKISIGTVITKKAHNEKRETQRRLNEEFNESDATVKEKGTGKIVPKPFNQSNSQYDGDHVLDLGFGGKDSADNFWPLNQKINRRAFNGYNSGYQLNYINDDNKYVSKAIGGLIGKHFVVKGFMTQSTRNFNVPDESKTEKAGTTAL